MSDDLDDELVDGIQPLPDNVSVLPPGDDDDPNQRQEKDSDGPLLDLSPKAAARYCIRLMKAQDKPMNHRKNRWRAGFWRQQGIPGIRVWQSNYDRAPTVNVYAPPGTPLATPSTNRAARNCRAALDYIFSDAPKPDPIPEADTDTARTAAEFTGRLLEWIDSSNGDREGRAAREAGDRMTVYGSGFVYYYVDPMGGGHKAKEILASPKATSVQDAYGEDGETPIDPTTQEPEPNAIKRYVAPDGQLVDKESAADRVWLKSIGWEVIDGRNIRFLPETCSGIWNAEGVQILGFTTLGQLKQLFPEAIEKLSNDALKKMVNYRPEKWRDLIPWWMHEIPVGTKPQAGDQARADDPPPDNAYCFWVRTYYSQGNEYPHGCYFAMAGSATPLYRGYWEAEGADGKMIKLDLPLAQFKGYNESSQDPYGISLMDKLGGMNEIAESLNSYTMEYLERFKNRKRYNPINGIVQPRSFNLPQGVDVAIAPGSEPFFEQIPPFPQEVNQFKTEMKEEMDEEIGLAGRGSDTQSVSSGAHAQLNIEELNKRLTELVYNADECIVRGWRIKIQLVAAFFEEPQIMLFRGEDNAWKAKEWSRSDIAGTRDVKMQKGSFTQTSDSMKMQLIQAIAQTGWIDQDEGREIARSNMSPMIALQDDPALLRIRRQISAWKEGPTPVLKAKSKAFQAQQAVQQSTAAPPNAGAQSPSGAPAPGASPTPPPPIPVPAAANASSPPVGQPAPALGTPHPPSLPLPTPAGGTPLPSGPAPQGAPLASPPVDPMTQAAATIFARQPVDIEPLVAKVRHFELAKVFQSSDFSSGKYDPAWQKPFTDEYNEMRTRAGIFTLEEQRMMYQYQIDMQMQVLEAPKTLLRGQPAPYDQPPEGQMGLEGGQQPGQPSPQGGQPSQAPQMPPQLARAAIPQGHAGLPLLPASLTHGLMHPPAEPTAKGPVSNVANRPRLPQ